MIDPGRKLRPDAVIGRDVFSCRHHAWAFDQAGVDGVADGRGDVPGGARIADAGDASAPHLLCVVDGLARAIFDGGIDMQLLARCRIAAGDVAVKVVEPGQYGLSAGVTDPGGTG